jgi:hypothetical protein
MARAAEGEDCEHELSTDQPSAAAQRREGKTEAQAVEG